MVSNKVVCSLRFCLQFTQMVEINGQHVNISSSAIHLGHTISSVDRSEIVKSPINNFWRHFNMFMSNFSSLSASMRNALFNQFCCSFYGSPLWFKKWISTITLRKLEKGIKIIMETEPQNSL